MVAPELVGTTPQGREQPLGKYDRRRGPPDDVLIAAHLTSDLTLASLAIGADGLARALTIDVDEGGEDAVLDTIMAALQFGLRVFADLHTTPGGHDGGRVWCLFAEGVAPERLHALGERIVEDAGLPPNTEVWPRPGFDLRLPLGVHRHTGRRGSFIAEAGVFIPELGATGTGIDLDQPGGVGKALALLPHLVNPIDLVPELPAPAPVAPVTTPLPRGAGDGESLIDRANSMSRASLYDLVTSYPSYTGRGKAISCGCGHHKHGDRRPSLEVIGGRSGKPLLRAYSPSCAHSLPGGHYHDPVSFVAALEGCSQLEAARRILGLAEQPARAPAYPTLPGVDTDRRHTDPAQVEARAREAARKREARRAAMEANREGARARAAEDAYLVDHLTVAAVLRELFTVAGDRDSCRPSNAQLAERIGRSERTVQRALEWLEGRYIVTEEHERDGQRWRGSTATNPRATAKRTFLREPLRGFETRQTEASGVTPAAPAMSPDHVESLETHDRPDPWEGGVTPAPGGEPAAWELWAFDPDGGPAPDELETLEPADAPPVEAVCEPEAEPVTIDGGASFDPAAEPGPARNLRGLDNWRELCELWSDRQPAAVAVADLAAELGVEDEHQVKGPPRDAVKAARYWKLCGAARKAASARQKRRLLTLAAELEEWYSAGEACGLYLRPHASPPPRPQLQLALAEGPAAEQSTPSTLGEAPAVVTPPSPAPGRAAATAQPYAPLPVDYDRAGLVERLRSRAAPWAVAAD